MIANQEVLPETHLFVPLPEGTPPCLLCLDGRTLVAEGQARQIRLYGEHDAGGYRWVQLELTGSPTYMLTLRLRYDADEEDVVDQLTQWLAQPTERMADVFSVSVTPTLEQETP